jgi:hypothetical protein
MNGPTPLETAAGLVQARLTDLETKLAVARAALLKVQTMMTTSGFGGMSDEQRITCSWAIAEMAYRETAPAVIVKPFTLADRSEQGAAIAADALRMSAAQRDYRGRRAYYASLTKAQKRKFNGDD